MNTVEQASQSQLATDNQALHEAARELAVCNDAIVAGEGARKRAVKIIREYRARVGTSRQRLDELADASGIHVSTLYRWLKDANLEECVWERAKAGDGQAIEALEIFQSGGSGGLRSALIVAKNNEHKRAVADRRVAESPVAEDVSDITVPEEVANAVEYVPKYRPPTARTLAESQTQIWRARFAQLTSIKMVHLTATTFNSGVPSSDGRYDLAMNGLTPAALKKILEVLR